MSISSMLVTNNFHLNLFFVIILTFWKFTKIKMETTKTCKKCGRWYNEASNNEKSCLYHPGKRRATSTHNGPLERAIYGTHTCCTEQNTVGCTRGKHQASKTNVKQTITA